MRTSINSRWKQNVLGTITEEKIAQTGPGEGTEFIYVDISSIDNESKRIVEPKRVAVAVAPSRARQELRAGDVVVSMTRPNLNAVALVPPELDGAIGSTGLHVLRAKDADPKWVYYAVQTNNFVEQMCRLVQGALYPAVRPKDIRAFSVPVPPREKQQEIVAEIEKQFTRLEAGVAGLRRVQASLKRYRAAVLKAACEGKLVPTEAELARERQKAKVAEASRLCSSDQTQWRDTSATISEENAGTEQDQDRDGSVYETGAQLLERILAERRQKWNGKGKYKEPATPDTANLSGIPEGWAWATAEQICEFITKGTTPRADKLHSGHGEVQFLKVYNLTFTGQLDHHYKPVFVDRKTHDKDLARSKVKSGDVLINIVGPPLGQVSIVPDEISEANINQAIARFRPLNGVSNRFLAALLQSKPVMDWAIHRAKTTAGQANLTLEICRELRLPVPPFAEQQRIVAEVERRLSVVEELEAVVNANLQRATRLRQSILQRAFPGEVQSR